VAALLALAVAVPLHSTLTVPPGRNGEIDSVTLWDVPGSAESLSLSTDKTNDRVEIHLVSTGQFLAYLGGTGSGPGQLQRPNGIAMVYDVQAGGQVRDVVFVVERDNNRVSMFAFPQLLYLGSFGSNRLRDPYGIAMYREPGRLQAWITNTGSAPDSVLVFDVVPSGAGLTGVLALGFPTGGTLESIVVDPVLRRVLVCDENALDVMHFDMQGNLQGRFGAGRFVDDPEGLVVYDLGNGDGYVIVTDQVASPTEFEVFDRRTLTHLGAFSGPTEGTDGIAMTQNARSGLPDGSFYALHLDTTVHVYDWADIATSLGLETRVRTLTDAAGEGLGAVAGRRLSTAPNPANPSTTLRYQLDAGAHVRLDIYDPLGRRITTLVDAYQPAGERRVVWNGRDGRGREMPSGVYMARLRAGGHELVHKVLLVD
jgi:3-phytase